MFWRTYGAVVGWMFVVGIVAAGLFLFVVFAWLVPPDRGEEDAVWLMPFFGGFFGALDAAAASLSYALALLGWTRRPGRSVGSRAGVGAVAAGVGALAFWMVFGYARSGPDALPVWSVVGAASAVLAVLVAGPLTVRAARRASGPVGAASPATASEALP
ncbi:MULTISPECIES: hypothetical protein [unclassified Microbacterium]|uniref:hypothetical protein n=1 Tax=unclassified Microbacterium TaxID=2609290 RepID=UPI00301803F6